MEVLKKVIWCINGVKGSQFLNQRLKGIKLLLTAPAGQEMFLYQRFGPTIQGTINILGQEFLDLATVHSKLLSLAFF